MSSTLLLFDFDGVIVDSLDLIFDIYNRIHHKYGLPKAKSLEDIRTLFNKNVYEALLERGIEKEKMRPFFTDLQMTTLREEHKMEPYPGVIEELRKLEEKGYEMTIISSNHSKVIHSFLKKYQIDDLFKEVIGGEEKTSKVEKIHHVVKDLNADPESTYYIGDTSGDVLEGKKAGVKTVGVCWGYHSKAQLLSANPDFLLENVNQLSTYLDD